MVKSISIILVGTLLFLAPAAHAITRRADKECLLCHILWFDVFKTDQKTLIGQRASAIVIAGSMGLASSREMCDTCHDGYVVDSRVKVVGRNPHHLLKKPPEGFLLPEVFRLDSNNEIYCGTCHTLHDFKDSATVGSTPFMRMKNERSQMCIACHGGKTKQQGYANHPVLKKASKIASSEAVKEEIKLGPAREIICQSCHNAHGEQAMLAPLKNSALCLICHNDKKSMINGKHNLQKTLPGEKNIKKRRPSESGPCGACHIPHNAVGKKLWARKLNAGNPASQMCLSCHGERSGSKTKHIGIHTHPTDVKPVSKEAVSAALPLFSADATRNPAGSVQCFTCHNVHQWDPDAPTNAGGKNLEGDASNSFLRVPNDVSSSLCLNCHTDKKQVISSDHNLNVTAPEEKNMQGFATGVSGPCGACHIPHNAAGNKLWARRLNPGPPAPQMCLTCHGQNTAFKAKHVGIYSHPVNVKPVSKKTVPAALPLFSADAVRDPAGRVQCFTCHNVHQWDPDAPTNAGGKNLEGDASNSFLRVPNDASSSLCLNCHTDKKQVISSDHNLNVTAPEEKNIQGLTAGISGPCGACHIPHNAAGKRLWAKALSSDTDWASRLCTGCHSNTGAAKAKLVGDYSHPIGVSAKRLNVALSGVKVLTEDLELSKSLDPTDNKAQSVPDLPLYSHDDDGKPGDNIACLTCHEPHTWDSKKLRSVSTYTFQNMEGDATNSFLRKANFPFPDLCNTCHLSEGRVEGTAHDLNESAPGAFNILGQTVKISGVCGACHLVHNSPGNLKLWARANGPVTQDESFINALCTSCHSKQSIAKNKIPAIATHPRGKLINNIVHYVNNPKDYTPLFDRNGIEKYIGDISCPSCHNAHQRGPLFDAEKNPNEPEPKIRGQSRFLRNSSDHIICRDCHGSEGLLRYLYFHDPSERQKK